MPCAAAVCGHGAFRSIRPIRQIRIPSTEGSPVEPGAARREPCIRNPMVIEPP